MLFFLCNFLLQSCQTSARLYSFSVGTLRLHFLQLLDALCASPIGIADQVSNDRSELFDFCSISVIFGFDPFLHSPCLLYQNCFYVLCLDINMNLISDQSDLSLVPATSSHNEGTGTAKTPPRWCLTLERNRFGSVRFNRLFNQQVVQQVRCSKMFKLYLYQT